MISLLLSLSISIHVSSTGSGYTITDTPVLLEFPQSLDKYIYVVFLNADHFVLSNGTLLNKVYKNPENFYVQTKVYPSFTMYIEIFQVSVKCDSIDFVLNYDPNPIELTSDLVGVSKSYCIFFASATLMDYTFYQDSLKNANVELYNYLTYIPHVPSLSDTKPEVTVTFSKNTILILQTSDQRMTGSCGLKSMEFSREDEYPLTSYVTNGTFSYTDSKSILPGSVNSNTEYYADINLMNNQNMRLRSGSYVLTFASGQSYNISQNQFIAFHTPKDQKICDVTASVKSGKNSETLLGNTSIYGVYYKSDGQLTLNSTKKYSSLYVTVYSANSGDGFFDEMFVLLGNTSQFIITDNHPQAVAGPGISIVKKDDSLRFYSAFVPGTIYITTLYIPWIRFHRADTNNLQYFTTDWDNITSTKYFQYPIMIDVRHASYIGKEEDLYGSYGIFASSDEYYFKSLILENDEKAAARFVIISDYDPTIEIIIIVCMVVAIIIVVVLIVLCCYCCCCKKKSCCCMKNNKVNAESQSSSSDSSSKKKDSLQNSPPQPMSYEVQSPQEGSQPIKTQDIPVNP